MKDLDIAEQHYLEAKSIYENGLGTKHRGYASCLKNLGALYAEMRNHKKAESLLLEAINVNERLLGKKHPKFATDLINVASLFKTIGKPVQAELKLQEVRTATWTGNKRMVRCAEKSGFAVAKRMPHQAEVSVRGEPLERIEFSISQEDWPAEEVS